MEFTHLLYAVLALGGLGALFGALLSLVARVFAVEVDERVEKISEILPGANCGACGYAGCFHFAEAVVRGKVEIGGCIPCGNEAAAEIAGVMGQEGAECVPLKAVVFCAGDRESSGDRFVYYGSPSCRHAEKMGGGFKSCSYGCLGLGDCVEACPFGAVKMGSGGLPLVDEAACTGCGLCVKACPRGIIKTVPREYRYHLVFCNSGDRGKAVLGACSKGCNACRACVKACPREAISVENNLAVIDMEKCDGCGECVSKCRQGCIKPLEEGIEEEEAAGTEKVSA